MVKFSERISLEHWHLKAICVKMKNMPKPVNFKKKPNPLGYHTPDRSKSMAIKRNLKSIAMTARPRCLGGHR